MKILHVIPFFAPQFGGSVTVTFDQCRELSKRGHDVTIITSDYQFNKNYADSCKDVKIIAFRHWYNASSFIYTPSMGTWLKKNLMNFDIIHMQNFRSYQNNVVHKWAMRYNVPYVVQPNGSLPRVLEKTGLKAMYDHVWGYSLLYDSACFIAVSNIEKQQFLIWKLNKNKIKVIPNGINISKLGQINSDVPYIDRSEKKEKRILFLGRIHKIKGLDILIEAFDIISKEMKDVTLVIAGPDGGYKDTLLRIIKRKKSSKRIKIYGFQKNPVSLYNSASILVYPSQYEIFGLVPLEAILCSIPVIVTKGCGSGEIVHKAKCGLLFNYGDVNGLVECIKQILNHPEIGDLMVLNGKQYIEKNLRWEVLICQVEGVYENCIRNI